MKIDHIFHHLNPFGGAEEHITSLAELQKARGDDVTVCLVQATTAQNQYAKRLKAAGIGLGQWPVWLSRLSGDWNTREAILHCLISLLTPLIVVAASLRVLVSKQSWEKARESCEGRLRTLLGRPLDPSNEKRLFLLLLTWRYYRSRPNVLHLHGYGAGLEYILEWANARNVTTIYQEHATPDLTKRRFYRMPTTCLNQSTVVVAVSQISAQAMRKLCNVTRPIDVIPPIVAVKGQDLKSEQSSERDDDVVYVATIARLSEEKGLNYLIEAAEYVVDARSDVCFKIYGEGDLRETLEAQIEAAQLDEHVKLFGSFKRDELPDIMNAVDIFVLPSITEGFPLSIVEAMAYGCPIIATSVGGVPELVEDGATGLLCPPGNVKALAKAILTLVNHPVRSQALGVAAREAYSNGDFRPECVVERFARTYSNALQMR